MLFQTMGQSSSPAVLFFHAMGVVGASSEPLAAKLQQEYFCIMPTSTVYCPGQKYVSKADEIRRVEAFLQEHCYFEFGSKEDHFKYRDAVMKAYPKAHYPVFKDYNHMQYQIRNPKGFAQMLVSVMEKDCMPELKFME